MNAEFASLASILDLANVIIHDVEGKILHWTTGCERLYGWSAAGGRRADRPRSPEDPISACRAARSSRRFGSCGSWRGEIEHETKSGSTVCIASLWVARKSDDGSIRFVLQTNSDITGLKRAQAELATREAHLRSILDTVPEAMIVIDERGVVDVVQRRGRETVRLSIRTK